MLNREIISDVRNSLRSIDIDSWLPAKYIYFKLRGITALFIKREADDKRLYRYTDLYSTIKCLKMEEANLIDCCNVCIPNCKKVMISKADLPEIYSTRYGYLMNVTSVDYDKDYIPVTPQQFKYTQSREFNDKSKRYFWLENKKLVIPIISETQNGPQRVTVKAMFANKADALRIDECVDTPCVRFLDQEFIAPVHLIQDIKNATIIEILKTNRQIVPDEEGNLNANEKQSPHKQ